VRRSRHCAQDAVRRLPAGRRALLRTLRRARPAVGQRGNTSRRDRIARGGPAGRRNPRRRSARRRRGRARTVCSSTSATSEGWQKRSRALRATRSYVVASAEHGRGRTIERYRVERLGRRRRRALPRAAQRAGACRYRNRGPRALSSRPRAVLERDFRLPAEHLHCTGDVGSALAADRRPAAPSKTISPLVPVRRLIVSASSISERSSGLPIVTGRCSESSASSTIPRIRSST